ncbi:hypothetical protein CEG14_14795 [Bordetella genomosp. 1]|uniref:Uncharacterized protein n=1 Tax=Bordetella genomosp. 1 TaxID=1395607 RepID=A0A261SH05_9BORD|nr:hypothetical protein [Bordetella genomosp. 1]OZI36277.1 hypothetical protein CEG14_14795 [Bordetella genomosp. 1]
MIPRAAWPYLIGAAVLALALAGWRIDRQLYGARQYDAGVATERAATLERQARVERAMQEERDRADANYRGAVLARQNAEKTVAAHRSRIDGLQRQLAGRRAPLASASGGSDGAGADWIGVVGACVAEYERLGRDAAAWADQVNGLQGYVRSLSPSGPPSNTPIVEPG